MRAYTSSKGIPSESKTVLFRAAVGVYMYAYTPITMYVLQLQFCRGFHDSGSERETFELLVADMGVECNTGNHQILRPIALAVFAIYGVLIPLSFAYKSAQQRAALDLSLAVCAVSETSEMWEEW